MSARFEGKKSYQRLYSDNPETVSSISPKAATEIPDYPAPANDSIIEKSPDQADAMRRISDFLQNRDVCFSLVGPAGSGKTTLLREAVELARQRTWQVRLSAPTHQAAARMREATGRHADTTHKLLGVSLVRDKKTGKEGLKAGQPMAEPRSFLIVDEASMLPEKLLKIIIKFAEKNECKVLFVGDAAQLNPVKEKPSKTVDRETCPWEIAELTTIHRQAAENPIIAAATAIRLADPNSLPVLETNLKDGQGIRVMQDKRAWAALMVEQCGDPAGVNKYIGYANEATDAAAKWVRRGMFGADAENPYVSGERLVVNARCVIADGKAKRKRGKKKKEEITIENNDLVTVKHVHRDGDRYFVTCDWHGHSVTLQAFENYKLRKQHLDRLRFEAKRKSNWSDFFEQSDTLADLRSAATMTAHKSQGSTFQNTFINLQELGKCFQREERQRLLYVAITRASGCVYLTGAL